jgi:hypothetical protein
MQANSQRTYVKAGLAVLATALTLAMTLPAGAQFWGNWDRPAPRQQQQPQQQYNPFGGWWGRPGPQDNRQQRERETPADFSRAPGPQKKPDAAAPTQIVVVGDSMADWLASGLEDAFSEKPEISVVRKHRAGSGLIRYEARRDIEWPQVIKELLPTDKPKFIVMMVGVNDRQQIRERAPTTPAGRQPAGAAKPAQPESAPAADPELQAQQSADQQNAELQETTREPEPDPIATPEPRGAQGNLGPFEFHTEKWEAGYIRRIDATIAAMKAAGVPVLWVGLPSQRNAKASTDSVYLNDLYRQRAEKAGITYVDVWDGFVDDAGRFTQQGPDFEGQIRRLRAGDGVYFTKAGARKLAHYVEREILRSMTNRATPMVSLPAAEPVVPAPGTRPGGSSTRPMAGPVVPLTISAGGGDELLGSARPTRPAGTVDPVATRVLTKGEPIPAPNGRGDDFAWPRGTAPMVVNVDTLVPAPTPAVAAGQPKGQPAASAGQPKGQPTTGAPATAGQADETKPATPPAQKRNPQSQPQRPRPSASFPSFFNIR